MNRLLALDTLPFPLVRKGHIYFDGKVAFDNGISELHRTYGDLFSEHPDLFRLLPESDAPRKTFVDHVTQTRIEATHIIQEGDYVNAYIGEEMVASVWRGQFVMIEEA